MSVGFGLFIDAITSTTQTAEHGDNTVQFKFAFPALFFLQSLYNARMCSGLSLTLPASAWLISRSVLALSSGSLALMGR